MAILGPVEQLPSSVVFITTPAMPRDQSIPYASLETAIGSGFTPTGCSGWSFGEAVQAIGTHAPIGTLALGFALFAGVVHPGSLTSPPPISSWTTPVQETKSLAISHRIKELRFQREHPEAFRLLAGQWVVLEGETIVTHGKDPVSVVAEARSRAVRVPYVFYVEESKDDSVWIGL